MFSIRLIGFERSTVNITWLLAKISVDLKRTPWIRFLFLDGVTLIKNEIPPSHFQLCLQAILSKISNTIALIEGKGAERNHCQKAKKILPIAHNRIFFGNYK